MKVYEVIPVYNEIDTIEEILSRVNKVTIAKLTNNLQAPVVFKFW